MNLDSKTLSRRALVAGLMGAVLPRKSSATTTKDHNHGAMAPLTVPRQETAPQDPAVGKLGNPWVAGQPRERPTEFDNDPFIISVEHRLKCNCGCAHSLYACRTTDFSCQFWQPLHAEVVEMAQEGMSAEEIIDAYVTRHGTQFLMAPPAEGFNLAGYLVPGIAMTFVAAGMAWLLQRKSKLASVAAAPTPMERTGQFSDEDEARLAEELKKLS